MREVDPDSVVIYFGGNRLTGFADGEFITYEPMSPAFTDVVGTDGEVTRSKSLDTRVKVVVKLMQSSGSNLTLSTALNNDYNTPNGAGVTTFQMQDLSGNTIVSGPASWVASYPAGSYDRTPKSREWEIHIANASITEGGN